MRAGMTPSGSVVVHPARMDHLGLEAPPGFEPGIEVLQTSALPLGDGAGWNYVLSGREIRPRLNRVGDNSVPMGR